MNVTGIKVEQIQYIISWKFCPLKSNNCIQ